MAPRSSNTKLDLSDHTRETLQALPRRQLQDLAKRNDVKANKKSDTIIRELLALKEARAKEDESSEGSEVQAYSQRASPIGSSATRDVREPKRRKVEVKSEGEAHSNRILRDRVSGRPTPSGRAAPFSPLPPSSPPIDPDADLLPVFSPPYRSRRIPNPIPRRNELPLQVQLGLSTYYRRSTPPSPAQEERGQVPSPVADPCTPVQAHHTFTNGHDIDMEIDVDESSDKENEPSAEEMNKENISPPDLSNPHTLPSPPPVFISTGEPLAVLEAMDPNDPACAHWELEYPDFPVAGPSNAPVDPRVLSFSPTPRPSAAAYVSQGVQAPEGNVEPAPDTRPLTHKDVRAFRRECTGWVNGNVRMEAEIRDAKRVLASVRDTIDEARKITSEKLIWKLCALEDNIASKFKTNRSILDGTGFMDSEEDNVKWRKFLKRRWEKQSQVLEESDDEIDDDEMTSEEIADGPENGGASQSGSDLGADSPRGEKRSRDEFEAEEEEEDFEQEQESGQEEEQELEEQDQSLPVVGSDDSWEGMYV